MGFTNTKTCIKYLIFGGIIYAILKIVPTKQLTVFEISTLVCVILIGIYSLECLTTSPKISENMESIRENMANSDNNIFDLDMDVDLDFNKSTGVKEDLNDSGANKSEDSLADKKKNKEEKPKIKKQIVEDETGLDMGEIQDELKRRNIKDIQLEKNEMLKETEILKDERDELRKEIEEDKKGIAEERRKLVADKTEAELDEQTKSKLLTFDKDPVNCEVEVAKMRRELQDEITKLKQKLVAKNENTNRSCQKMFINFNC